jgi:hypothetical protein
MVEGQSEDRGLAGSAKFATFGPAHFGFEVTSAAAV